MLELSDERIKRMQRKDTHEQWDQQENLTSFQTRAHTRLSFIC